MISEEVIELIDRRDEVIQKSFDKSIDNYTKSITTLITSSGGVSNIVANLIYGLPSNVNGTRIIK